MGASKHNLIEKLEEEPTIFHKKAYLWKIRIYNILKGQYETKYFNMEESLWCSINNTGFGVRRPQFLPDSITNLFCRL